MAQGDFMTECWTKSKPVQCPGFSKVLQHFGFYNASFGSDYDQMQNASV